MYTTGHSMAPVSLTLMFSVLLNTDVDRMKNQAAVYAFLLLSLLSSFLLKEPVMLLEFTSVPL